MSLPPWAFLFVDDVILFCTHGLWYESSDEKRVLGVFWRKSVLHSTLSAIILSLFCSKPCWKIFVIAELCLFFFWPLVNFFFFYVMSMFWSRESQNAVKELRPLFSSAGSCYSCIICIDDNILYSPFSLCLFCHAMRVRMRFFIASVQSSTGNATAARAWRRRCCRDLARPATSGCLFRSSLTFGCDSACFCTNRRRTSNRFCKGTVPPKHYQSRRSWVSAATSL